MEILKKIPSVKGKRLALFFDLDGTLLSGDEAVFSENIEYAKKAADAGHLIFINTGRSKAYLPKGLLDRLPFSGMICGASYIEYGGEILKNDVISPDARRQLIEVCRREDIPLVFEGVDTNYYYKIDTNQLKITDDVQMKDEKGYVYVEDFIADDTVMATKATFHKKITDIDMSAIDLIRVIKFASYGEAIILGNNKANAMEILLEKLGIDTKDTIAFGDSENDVEMLRLAGVAVVMPHGAAGAKENAHIIGTIKEAVEYLLL